MSNQLTYRQAKAFIKQRLTAMDVEYAEDVRRRVGKTLCRFVPHSMLPTLRLTLTEDSGVISFGYENSEGKLEHFRRKDVDEQAIMSVFNSALAYFSDLRQAAPAPVPLRPKPIEPYFRFDSEGITVHVTAHQARDPEVMAAVYLLIDTIKEGTHA